VNKEEKLIRAKDLVKYFRVPGMPHSSVVHAVDHVDIEIERDQTFGLVGESGCGKSTLGRTLLLLTRPDFGKILFDGLDLLSLSEGEIRKIRPNMQIVFQDPMSSLDPRMRVKDIVAEPLVACGVKDKRNVEQQVGEILSKVGLKKDHAMRFPHEFSGGQR